MAMSVCVLSDSLAPLVSKYWSMYSFDVQLEIRKTKINHQHINSYFTNKLHVPCNETANFYTYILPRSAFFCVMLFCRSLIGAMSEAELSFSWLQCAVSNSTHQVR